MYKAWKIEENSDFYFSIFVDGERGAADILAETMHKLVGGEIDGRYVETDNCHFGVMLNKKYCIITKRTWPENFCEAEFVIEVAPREDLPVDRKAFEETIVKLLTGLWDAGYKAIAACGFEDELPVNPENKFPDMESEDSQHQV